MSELAKVVLERLVREWQASQEFLHPSQWADAFKKPSWAGMSDEQIQDFASKASLSENALSLVDSVDRALSGILKNLVMTPYWAANGRKVELRIKARVWDHERTVLPKLFAKSEEKDLVSYICPPSYKGDINSGLGRVNEVAVEEAISQRDDVVRHVQEKLKEALSYRVPVPTDLKNRIEGEEKESEIRKAATAVRNLKKSMEKVRWLSEEDVISMWRTTQVESVMKS